MVDLPGFPDIASIVSRILNNAQAELVRRVLAAGGSIVLAGTEALRQRAEAIAQSWLDVLASLPHAIADRIAELDRGSDARRLTGGEASRVREAFGQRVPADWVRIVRGPGLSLFAFAAFRKGNPAITIGNTIYIKYDYNVPHADLTGTIGGVRLLCHEYTHVVQWREQGYTGFGKRYASELWQNGCNPDRLYDYQNRNTTYASETLEGQASIVGDYSSLLVSPQTGEVQQRVETLRQKLKGTGIYGL